MNLRKKSRLAVLVLVFLLLCASCTASQDPQVPQRESGSSVRIHPEAGENALWYCNRLNCLGAPPFPLPEGEPTVTDYFLTYPDTTREAYQAYLQQLRDAGFACAERLSAAFLFRDDCIISLFYPRGQANPALNICWYTQTPAAPRKGLTGEEATALLLPEHETSLSPIPVHPIDISPEGMYERTGGQIFVVPTYTFDTYHAGGHDEAMLPENERYDLTFCFVREGQILSSPRECFAYGDVDGDGQGDALSLDIGPTSGLYSFCLRVLMADGQYEHFSVLNRSAQRFVEKDGKIAIKNIYPNGTEEYCDIALETVDGKKNLILHRGIIHSTAVESGAAELS